MYLTIYYLRFDHLQFDDLTIFYLTIYNLLFDHLQFTIDFTIVDMEDFVVE